MPGIAGIIGSFSAAEAERLLTMMISRMKHDAGFASAIVSAPEAGVWCACASMPRLFPSPKILSDTKDDLVLVLAGECFPEPGDLRDDWLLERYRNEGRRFVQNLNGLFSGLLIDRRQRQSFLFIDRYGLERIYWTATSDGFFFASEAKALLAVRPECRTLDQEGVADFLNFGCVTQGRTLFRGISLLPAASRWIFSDGACRKETYFSPETWESQPALPITEFQEQFQTTLKLVLPRYFHSPVPLGISLTGGLDTRMIMACRPESTQRPICFTYSGERVDPLDVRIARKVASACGLEHKVLHIERDFFSDFSKFSDDTVYATDGTFGVTGAHEIYMSRLARQLAPCRLTGNYGGEIFRGVSTFKSIPLAEELISPDFRATVDQSRQFLAERKHPITFAAFSEVPWNLFGNLQAGRSQIGFRTPYLDNDLVALSYRMPQDLQKSRASALRLVRESNPALAAIPTDRACLGASSSASALLRRVLAEITFKLDYINNEGFPHWLSPAEPLSQRVGRALGILGLHKHLHYRSWFRRDLADFVRQRLAEAVQRPCPFWNAKFLRALADDHVRGHRNYVLELNAVLTLDAVKRLLLN